jgi:hypothetical protein
MTRQEISALLAEGEAFDRAGRAAEAYQVAIGLVQGICAARSLRRDKSTGIRETDADAIAWAQSVIEKHDFIAARSADVISTELPAAAER